MTNSVVANNSLWPRLSRLHPGYFGVMCFLLVLHLLQVCDLLLPGAADRHSGDTWYYINQFRDPTQMGILHLLVALYIIVGLYTGSKRSMKIIHISQWLSMAMFGIQAIGFLLAMIKFDVSFYFFSSAVFVIGVSFMAYREPPYNPVSSKVKTISDLD